MPKNLTASKIQQDPKDALDAKEALHKEISAMPAPIVDLVAYNAAVNALREHADAEGVADISAISTVLKLEIAFPDLDFVNRKWVVTKEDKNSKPVWVKFMDAIDIYKNAHFSLQRSKPDSADKTDEDCSVTFKKACQRLREASSIKKIAKVTPEVDHETKFLKKLEKAIDAFCDMPQTMRTKEHFALWRMYNQNFLDGYNQTSADVSANN